jgi:hypothetical protein
LDDLQAQLKILEAVRAILKNQKADITDICARLDRFAAIWGLVIFVPQLDLSNCN